MGVESIDGWMGNSRCSELSRLSQFSESDAPMNACGQFALKLSIQFSEAGAGGGEQLN